MSLSVSSDLTASVKGYCSSTAAADVSSALSLFEFYCSAAAKKVVATALESISETRATGVSKTGSRPTSPGQTDGSSTDGSTGGGGGGGGGLSRGAVIAIAVLASLVGIGIIVVIWFVVRRRNRKSSTERPPTNSDTIPFGDIAKPVDGPTPTQSPWSELDSRHEAVPHGNEMAVTQGQGSMTPMHEAASSMIARPPPASNYNDGQGWNFGQGTTHEMDAGVRHPDNR